MECRMKKKIVHIAVLAIHRKKAKKMVVKDTAV